MPQHKSAAKRMKTSVVRRQRNKARKATVKKAVKDVRTAPDKATASERLVEALSSLDKVAMKGTIHKNKADRLKSRLTKSVNAKES